MDFFKMKKTEKQIYIFSLLIAVLAYLPTACSGQTSKTGLNEDATAKIEKLAKESHETNNLNFI